jgi:hypothetical protein
MKTALAALAGLIAAEAPLWAAQQEYIYVTNRGATSNNVMVFKQPMTPLTQPPAFYRTITDPVFNSLNAPFDIIADPARRRLYVSNNGGLGAITIISGDTLAVVGVINVSVGQLLKGMAMSDDGAFLYVAGQTAVGTVPAVFEINLNTLAPATVLNSNGASGDSAEACAVIPAGISGGAGSGPGRIYYSVTSAFGPSYIAIAYKVGAGAAKFTTGAVPLANVGNPMRMARSPDGTVAFVTCTATDNNLRIIRIDAAANAAAEISVVGTVAPRTTFDVAFRPEVASLRAYVHGLDKSAVVYEVDSTGLTLSAGTIPAFSFPPDMMRHHLDASGNDFLYFGNNLSTVNDTGFGRLNSAVAPPAGPGTLASADGVAGAGPTYFAFMTIPPPPGIDHTCPKGDVNVQGNVLTVEGANFFAGASIHLPGASSALILPTAFVNSGTLQGTTVAGALLGELDVTVINPDGQQALLHQFYTTCAPALTPWTLTLPSLTAGYSMFSVPQYSSVSSLRAALNASLGPYNPVFYRVFFWQVDQYVELNNMSDDCDLAGRSFWALTRLGGSCTVNGLDCFANRVSGIRVIPLNPGWNMISLPYQNAAQIHMNWTNVQVTADGAAWSGAGPADGTPALLNPLLYEFVNGGYVTVNVLQSGHGYFVNNVTSSFAYLLFNGTQVFKPGAGPAPSYTALAAGVAQPPGPPGAGVMDGSSSKKHGCGFLGPELLLVALAFHRLRRRRRLGA